MRKLLLVLALMITLTALAAPKYVLRFNTVAAPTQPQVLAVEPSKWKSTTQDSLEIKKRPCSP